MPVSLYSIYIHLLVLPAWRILDVLVPKCGNTWGFAVHHIKADQFVENPRALFEAVKADPHIRKILFSRADDSCYAVDGAENFMIVRLGSLRSYWYLARCKVLIVSHSISMDYALRWGKRAFAVLKTRMRCRIVVNVWHGTSIKKLYALANGQVRQHLDRVSFRRKERSLYKGLIASSDIDSYASGMMFHPIHPDQIWITGLPKNDFLLNDTSALPRYLQSSLQEVSKIKAARKLVLYAPTYRQTVAVNDAAYYHFSPAEIESLKEVLRRHNAILGFRMHYFRNGSNLFNMESYIDNEFIFDLGHAKVPEISSAIRMADLVITDYSSIFIDAMYASKPLISFAYDLPHYRKQQEGLLYDLEFAFPGPVVQKFDAVLEEMDRNLADSSQVLTDRYQFSRQLFFKYHDANNARRVADRIAQLNQV